MKPTLVLVHGAYADSSSWDGVVPALMSEGHRVVAWANPLRSVTDDAKALSALVRSLGGPVVLVGHSYGGAVITNVEAKAGQVTGLVFVAGFALQPGESCGDASSLVPGGTLAETLERVPLGEGVIDTYIAQDRYHQQFAADLPEPQAIAMAVTQRPVTESALFEPSGSTSLWTSVPSWFIYGELDHNIPAGAHQRMAERAGAQDAVEVPGASHVVGISHPSETVHTILSAASERSTVSA